MHVVSFISCGSQVNSIQEFIFRYSATVHSHSWRVILLLILNRDNRLQNFSRKPETCSCDCEIQFRIFDCLEERKHSLKREKQQRILRWEESTRSNCAEKQMKEERNKLETWAQSEVNACTINEVDAKVKRNGGMQECRRNREPYSQSEGTNLCEVREWESERRQSRERAVWECARSWACGSLLAAAGEYAARRSGLIRDDGRLQIDFWKLCAPQRRLGHRLLSLLHLLVDLCDTQHTTHNTHQTTDDHTTDDHTDSKMGRCIKGEYVTTSSSIMGMSVRGLGLERYKYTYTTFLTPAGIIPTPNAHDYWLKRLFFDEKMKMSLKNGYFPWKIAQK